jgi:hypothetical protein
MHCHFSTEPAYRWRQKHAYRIPQQKAEFQDSVMPEEAKKTARGRRGAAQDVPDFDRPKPLNIVALNRRRLILGKAMAQRQEQRQLVASQRLARRAFVLTVLVLAALAGAHLLSFAR